MIRITVLLILFISLVSCGGGSGGDWSPLVSGSYRLSDLTLINDSCELGLPDVLSDTKAIEVYQVNETLGLSLSSAVNRFLPRIDSKGLNGVRREFSFLGLLDRERKGFTLRTADFEDNQCVSGYSLDFDQSIKPDSNFDVMFLFDVTCPNKTCSGSYEGTASRRYEDQRSRYLSNLTLIHDSCELGLPPTKDTDYFVFREGNNRFSIRSSFFLPYVANELVLEGKVSDGRFPETRLLYLGSNNGGFIVTNQFTLNKFTDNECVVKSTISHHNGEQVWQFEINCPNRTCEGLYSGPVWRTGFITGGAGR
jgi:hypothetical protein